jgi:hypothetical protein
LLLLGINLQPRSIGVLSLSYDRPRPGGAGSCQFLRQSRLHCRSRCHRDGRRSSGRRMLISRSRLYAEQPRHFTRDSRKRRPTIASTPSRPAIRSKPDKSDAGPAHRGAANPAIRRREWRAGKPPFLTWLFPELVGRNSEACSALLPLKRIGGLRDANPPYSLIEIILPRGQDPDITCNQPDGIVTPWATHPQLIQIPRHA